MSTEVSIYSNPVKPTSIAWRWVRLEEVCEINPRRVIPSDRDDDAPTTFIPMAAIDERVGIVARPETKPYGEVKKGYTFFTAGDILFAKITPCMQNGKHAVVRETVDGIGFASTEFHVLRPNPEIACDWIHYFLRQPVVLRAAMAHFAGAVGQQRVPEGFLASLEIPLPPLSEQKRIAAIITEQLAAVERARAAAEAQLEAARALPAAYLRAVFNSPEAREWPRMRLEEVAILERGKFTPRPRNDPRYFGGPYPWIQIGEVEAANKYIRHHRSTLNDLGLSVSKMFPKGTLVISIAASIGAVGILGFDSCMPDSLVGITPRTDLSDSEFLYYMLILAREHLESIAPQMAQANLKLAMLNPLEIFLPPLVEQKRISLILNERLAAVDRVRKSLEDELAAINTLPAALLQEAFNGEL